MIKNNPFITVLLLLLIEVAFFYYADYMNFKSMKNQELGLIIFFFAIPFSSLILNLFLKNNPYKKSFKIFLNFLLVSVAVLFFALRMMLG